MRKWLRGERSRASREESALGVCYHPEFMQTGIIGLPQVGKTTLFRIMTKAAVDAKGGQATKVGIAKVPEPRLAQLADAL